MLDSSQRVSRRHTDVERRALWCVSASRGSELARGMLTILVSAQQEW